MPKNSTLPVINVGQLANGSYLVTVTKTTGGATVASQTIVVACNPATPGALIAGSCINDKGNVRVTLSNTGDFDISLTVVFNGGTPLVVNVPKNTPSHVINFGPLDNGAYPVAVTKTSDGAAVASTTINILCQPANPAATIVGSCINDKGNVAVTLSNTGDFDINLTVVFNGGTPMVVPVPKTSTLAPINFGPLDNGSYPVSVSDGESVIAGTTIVIECEPANPAAAIVGSCVNNAGNVAVTLSNTGDFDVVLTLTVGAGAATQHNVPANSTLPVIDVGNLADGSYPVVVMNGAAIVANTTILVACSSGTGTVSPTHECSGFNGTVTLTFTHTGGNAPVDFVVDGATYTMNPGDAPKSAVYTNVADGTFTKVVTINGVPTTISVEVHCDLVLTGAPICNEVNINNVVTTYWYSVTNPGSKAALVTWSDGAVTVPAGATVTIKSASPTVAVQNEGITAVTISALSDVCGNIVKFTKELVGQPPTGETYKIRVSRLVAPNYQTYLTFDLIAGQPQLIELPSSLDGVGISYKIEEIDDGTASLHTVSPDTFSLQGNLGETVSVVVTNGYAAVSIDKTVSKTVVKGGETLVYTLIATNTGGLTLDPVVITDSLPPNLAMSSALVADGKGTCVLSKSTRPQLITCDLNDALVQGQSTAAITIVALVDVDTVVGTTIVNQAKVLGTYVGAPNAVTGLTAQAHAAEVARLRADALLQGETLSCLPVVDGTVCDLSAKIGSLVEAQTASEPPPVVVPVVPEPVLVTPPISELPVTGSTGLNTMVTIGFVLLGLGGAVIFARRRRPIQG